VTITPAATLLVTCGGIARSGWWLIASAVVGGDKVAADHQAIRRHVADLDIVLVRAERPEQRAHELHPAVVGRRNRPATSPSRRAQSRTASSTASPSGEVVISSSLRSLTRAQ
jgi:hypothetical protein